MSARILVAEDYPDTLERIARALEEEGFEVSIARDGETALRLVRLDPVDVVVSDFKMDGLDGLSLHERIREQGIVVPFVLYSSSAPSGVPFRAGRDGVLQFLDYPFDIQSQLIPTIRRALQHPTGARATGHDAQMIGTSAGLEAVRSEIRRYAPTNATVLITGETGTGKELVARNIHASSSRSQAAFVKVNCPALPGSLVESELFGHEKGAFTGALRLKKGRFETAEGGTVFLDEIGEVDLQLQAKLLQVLQDGSFERVGGSQTIRADVRVVAATNQDLRVAVRKGRFREDLYYRLAQVAIHVPPLRDREDDIEPLVRTFLEEYADEHQRPKPEVSDGFMEAVRVQRWHGNVREIRATMQRAILWWDGTAPMDALCFMQAFAATDSSLSADERLECQQMLQAYARSGRNHEAARRSLGMSRAAWRHRWEKKFGLQVVGGRRT